MGATPDLLRIWSEKLFFVPLRTLGYAFIPAPRHGVRGKVESYN